MNKLKVPLIIFLVLIFVISGYIVAVNISKDKNDISSDDNGIKYDISSSGCKMGIDDTYFYKVCSSGEIVRIDELSCEFKNCSEDKEIDVSDWIIYENDAYGIYIKYPKGWVVTEGKNGVYFYDKDIDDSLPTSEQGDYISYSIKFYDKNDSEFKDYEMAAYLEEKRRSSEQEEIVMQDDNILNLYITSELNEKNFQDTIDLSLPQSAGYIDDDQYDIFVNNDANYYNGRRYYESLNYLKAAIGTLKFK
ncbi:MAG: hypothetical protein OEV93_02520 [Candidatus Moranbacteria bacterium]|nr:hypothetical protein [Candidatus Moranbacteria bacterium]